VYDTYATGDASADETAKGGEKTFDIASIWYSDYYLDASSSADPYGSIYCPITSYTIESGGDESIEIFPGDG